MADTSLGAKDSAPAAGYPTYRWAILTVVFLFGLFENMSLLATSIVNPVLLKVFHFTSAQVGALSSVSSWIAIAMAMVGGYLADRFGPKLVGAFMLVLASVGNFLWGASGSIGSMVFARVIYGVGGNGGATPVGNRVFGLWTPPPERGRAAAIFNFSFPLGTLVLIGVGLPIEFAAGWQTPLYLLGGLGVVVLILWLAFVSNRPTESRFVRPEQAGYMPKVEQAERIPLGTIIRSSTITGTGLAWGLSGWSFIFLVAWLPAYFVIVRHLNLEEAAAASIGPWVGGALMGLLAGFITDAVRARTGDLRKARTYLAAAGQFVFGVAILATLFAQSVIAVAVLLFIAEGCNELSASIFQVIPVDTLAERAGSATGWIFLLANLFVTLSPVITGPLLIHGTDFLPAFLVAGILPLIGGVILLTAVYPGHLHRPRAEAAAPATSA